jgi:two-component system, sensor histidine kinase RpfC
VSNITVQRRILRLVAFLASPFRGRPDSEHEQALLRIALGLIVFFVLLGVAAAKGHLIESEIQGLSIIVPLLIASIGIYLWICFAPEISHSRRITGMLTDISAITACLLMSGELAAGIFCLYLWVTFGNGFRFGKSYLTASHMMSFVGFTTVILFNDYWQTHKTFAFSMLIALAVLPLYIGMLLERLNEAKRRAEEANSAKSRFIANMSHELRTPLAGITGINQLLMNTALTAQQQDLLRTQTSAAGALLDLIESVLDLSKIEAGRLTIDIEDFDLYRAVSDTMRMFRHKAEQQGLKFYADIAPEVPYKLRGDPKRLRQVLINLVGNAIKFTPHGSVCVRVTARPISSHEAHLKFEVVDTGIGISNEARTRIFERFAQEDESTSRRFGGTGLGTTIAKQLVELMGGVIGLESQVSVGTTFWFEVPLGLQIPSASVGKTEALGTLRVLILGKDQTEIRRIEEHVRTWNGEVRIEASPENAFAAAKIAAESRAAFQAIVCASAGFDADLTEFATGVRLLGLRPMPSLVIVGNNIDVVTRAHLLQQGYSNILRSPVDKSVLFNALHGALVAASPEQSGVIALADRFKERPKAERTLRILLAEDNLTNQKVIEGVLASAGHEVLVADSGERALDLIQDEQIDLAVVDMNMPETSGVDVIRQTRSLLLDKRELPFIVLTANATLEAKQECLAAGADAFLTKPVAFPDLLDTIEQLSSPQRAVAVPAPDKSAPRHRRNTPIVLDEASLRDLESISTSPAFAASALDVFAQENRTLVAEAGQALREGRFQAVRDIAHSIKGNAGSVGALAVMEHATQLNRATQNDLLNDGEVMIAALEAAFEQALLEIEKYKTRVTLGR